MYASCDENYVWYYQLFYSETTSTKATRGLQPIRNGSWNKQMNMRTSREPVLFFDCLVSILNFWPSSKTLPLQPKCKCYWFSSTTRNYCRFESKKFRCKTKKKQVSLYWKRLRIGKNHPGKRPGCYYVNKTSVWISLFGCTLFQTL